jgi:oligopeptide transport system permease protein
MRTVRQNDGHILRLDFGESLKYQHQSVNSIIIRSLPTLGDSRHSGLPSRAVVIGVTIGSIAALKQNSGWDYASMTTAMLGISIPNFVLGPLLVMLSPRDFTGCRRLAGTTA